MKLLTVAFLPLLRADQIDCDLSGTPIFSKLENGKFGFGKYKLKMGGGPLQNKGKLQKAKAILAHKKEGDYSDANVACADNKVKSVKQLKCFADGTFTVDGKSGDDIEWIDCVPDPGCDPDDLGVFGKIEYTAADKCKRGYITVDGKKYEKKNNYCVRRCNDLTMGGIWTSGDRIKCMCDAKSKKCAYKVKYYHSRGWDPLVIVSGWPNPWNTILEPVNCTPKTTTTTTTTTTTAPSFSEWGDWNEWGLCSNDCGIGQRTRTRNCNTNTAGDPCPGVMEPIVEPCVDYRNYENNPDCQLEFKKPRTYTDEMHMGEYCIFPSAQPETGDKRKQNWFEGDVNGVRVVMTVECTEGEWYDNGSYVIAKKGAKCRLKCDGNNDKKYRPYQGYWTVNVNTFDTFTCLNPIPAPYYHYCDDLAEDDRMFGRCVQDYIEKGFDVNAYSYTTLPWYFSYQTDKGSHSIWNNDLEDHHHHSGKQCYEVIDETCPEEFPRNSVETAAGTDPNDIKWTCEDGNSAKSICRKSCHGNTMAVGRTNELAPIDIWARRCNCRDTCEWEVYVREIDTAISCIPGTCEIGSPSHMEAALKCKDENGQDYTYDQIKRKCERDHWGRYECEDFKFPAGATCNHDCTRAKHDSYEIFNNPAVPTGDLTCTCADNKCSFNKPGNWGQCHAGYCDDPNLYDTNADNAEELIQTLTCDKVVENSSWWSQNGKALAGATCQAKCKGFPQVMQGVEGESHELKCVWKQDQGKFGWEPEGPYPQCKDEIRCPFEDVPVKGYEYNNGLDWDSFTWDCDNGNAVGSKCQKSCPEGFTLDGSDTEIVCFCQREGCRHPFWKGRPSKCLKNKN